MFMKPMAKRSWKKTLALFAASTLGLQLACAQCAPPPEGIIGWWPGDGNYQDIVGNHDGIPNGDLAFATGKVGQAVNYFGTNSFVELSNTADLNLSQFTVETWVFVGPPSQSNRLDYGLGMYCMGAIVTKGFPLVGNFYLAEYYFTNAGNVSYEFWLRVFGDGVSDANAKLSNVTPAFYHIAATFDGHVARLYVNGELAGTGERLSGAQSSWFPIRIGASDPSPSGWHDSYWERIDETALYNRALKAYEIAAIYAAGAAGKCRGFCLTLQPKSQFSFRTKSASFTVAAAYGSKPYTYQWRKDGADIPGATNSVLTLTNLQVTDEGIYTVLASDTFTNVLSQQATLTVNPVIVSVALHAAVTVDGLIGHTYGVQSTTDLNNTNSWVGRTNITLANPTEVWYDPQPATSPQTYYRALPGPIPTP
jgi:hypothetical protein